MILGSELVRCSKADLPKLMTFTFLCFQRKGFVVSPFRKPSSSSSRNSSRASSPDSKVLKRKFDRFKLVDCITLAGLIPRRGVLSGNI